LPIECGVVMNDIGEIFYAATKLLPADVQFELCRQLRNSENMEASPAGATLMGVYMLSYVGFPRYIDEILGEAHTSIEELRTHYHSTEVPKEPMKPSSGIIASLLVADMIARPRRLTPAYKFEEMAELWRTGPLLGISPSLLNDDRIGRVLSAVGAETETMEEVLFRMVMDAGKKAGIPLNKFILDTTVLELDGKFKNADKVVPGRGRNSFAQLIVSLVIASGSRMPVGFAVLAGNTNDATTLPAVYETVNRIADEGSVEFIMDRIYPTPSNVAFLREREQERMVYWVSPLKMGLSKSKVRQLIEEAYEKKLWKSISYRSSKEIKTNTVPPLSAFESTWTLTETIKPELEPGQTRRPKGSIKTTEIEVRSVFYRHEIQAERDRKNREEKQEQLNLALLDFSAKLNKRQYRELVCCQNKLTELLRSYPDVKQFLQYDLSQTDNGSIALTWFWQESALAEELKYDGTFALLTNYTPKQVNANQLVAKYRSRDEVEVDFKQMRGLLDLERVLYTRPERIDSYVFLKVIALFVLTFMRAYAKQNGVKATEQDIQESMGNILLTDTKIMPVEMKVYRVGRDSKLTQLFRELFSLPEPHMLIRVLNEAEIARVDEYVLKWYEAWLQEQKAPQ
jgi:transposase